MARIAAVHALGDIWAMGAEPQAATATVILPRMTPALQEAWLAEIMAAASAVFAGEGAAVVGGHTSLGAELTLGFTVTGICRHAPLTLTGARPGDALILTKPLGSGTILAGEMALAARGPEVAACWDEMVRPQGTAARALAGARAMTDVTGFGLAGHLMNMLDASGAAARLALRDVPLLVGAERLARAGVRSTIFEQNRQVAPRVSCEESAAAALLVRPADLRRPAGSHARRGGGCRAPGACGGGIPGGADRRGDRGHAADRRRLLSGSRRDGKARSRRARPACAGRGMQAQRSWSRPLARWA